MPISPAHRLGFVHIPRTGGTSVVRALVDAGASLTLDGRGLWEILSKQREPEQLMAAVRATFRVNSIDRFAQQHLPARALRTIVGEDAYKQLFTFAIVRNPWDLLVSSYEFQRVFARYTNASESESKQIIERCPTFADYVHLYPALRSDMTEMLCDEQGRSIVDFVGRFESLVKDVVDACARRALEVNLPHANRSEHSSYRTYYSAETRSTVARHFARDIERFDYRF